jgi:hypothetical protein
MKNTFFLKKQNLFSIISGGGKFNFLNFKFFNFKILSIFLIAPLSSTFAQLPCLGVSSDCVNQPNNTYKCIDASIYPTFQSAILGGLLIETLNNSQRIIIKGVLKLTSATGTFTFVNNSEIVFADNTSGIEIESGTTLNIQTTEIHATCQSYWNSIVAKSGSSLIISNSEVLNGTSAIVVEHGASISVTETKFRQNLIGLTLGTPSTSGNIYFTPDGSISGNSFIGSNITLIEGAARSGIQMFNVQNNVVLTNNKISNFIESPTNPLVRTGIELDNSKATINGGSISSVHHIGIYAKNGSNLTVNGTNQSIPMIVGCGVGVYSYDANTSINGTNLITPLINQCNTGVVSYSADLTTDKVLISDTYFEGIYLYNSNLSANNTHFNKNEVGILYEIDTIATKKSVIVDKCKFSDFKVAGVLATSVLLFPLNLNDFVVTNSEFITLNPNGQNFAIDLSSNVFTQISTSLNITGNNIKCTSDKLFIGIRVSQIDQPMTVTSQIHNNTIQQLGGGSDAFVGVKLSNSMRVVVSSNTISSASIDGSIGIEVVSSPNYKVSCNALKGLSTGVRFRHLSTSSNGFYANVMENCSNEGLLLDFAALNPARMGVQNKTFNRWIGSTSGNDAVFELDNYDPSDNSMIVQSKFIINGTDESTNYWANPRAIIDAVDPLNPIVYPDDMNVWFKGDVPVLLQLNCSTVIEPGGEVSESEKKTMDGLELPYKGYAATVSDSKFILYDRLNQDALLRPSGSSESSWYNVVEGSAIGQLNAVYRQYLALSPSSSSLSPTALLAQINSINCTEPFEMNMKSVLRILIQKYIGGTSVNTAQLVAELQSIAVQCRLEGGLAVDWARNILGLQDTPYGECVTKERSKSSNEGALLTNTVKVSPNPAHNSFIVQLEESEPEANVRLYNFAGKQIGIWSMNNTFLQIQNTSFESGIYFLEVSTPTKMLGRSKLILIK